MNISKFQFTDPYVTAVTYAENKDFALAGRNSVDMPVSLKHTAHAEEAPGKAAVELRVTVGDKSDQTPFCLSVTMMAWFRWDSAVFSTEMTKQLLEKNAVSLLLSYCRPVVATLTSQSRFPAYNIPFIDLTDEKK